LKISALQIGNPISHQTEIPCHLFKQGISFAIQASQAASCIRMAIGFFEAQRRSTKNYDSGVAVYETDLQTFGLQPSTRER